MKRISMKFRKQMLKDLRVKHKKKDRSERKKKKKLKSELQLIAHTGENPTKLIIRFGKKSDSGTGGGGNSGDCDKRTSGCESEDHKKDHLGDPNVSVVDLKDPLADTDTDDKYPPPPIKLTPIKLKLSRCQEGSGYVMKPPVHNATKEQEEERSVQPGQPPPDPLAIEATPSSSNDVVAERSRPAPPLPKDCEVR